MYYYFFYYLNALIFPWSSFHQLIVIYLIMISYYYKLIFLLFWLIILLNKIVLSIYNRLIAKKLCAFVILKIAPTKFLFALDNTKSISFFLFINLLFIYISNIQKKIKNYFFYLQNFLPRCRNIFYILFFKKWIIKY